jgi:hypothetical protein
MAPPDQPGLDLSNTLGEVGKLIEKLGELVEQMRDSLNRYLPWLGPLAHQVRSAWDGFVAVLRKVLSEIGKVFTQPGVPWTLWSHANAWLDDIGGKVDRWSQEVTPDRIASDDRWQGDAATKYMESVSAQKTALDQIKPATNDIQTALRLVAGAIVVFWGALLAFLITYIVEMVAAAGGIGSVIGALPGVLLAAASTAKFWVAFGVLVVALGAAFTAFETQLGSLKSRLDTGVFAAGHWPPATTTNWNDASVSDGNPTKWRIKQ